MHSAKNVVIETLRHPYIQSVNFQYGGTRVYPQGYRRIADEVESGRIEIVAGTGASYNVDAARGTVHTMTFPPQMTYIKDNNVFMRALGPRERGTIVHEATHALQDYQQLSGLRPQMAEGAAYVAANITALRWGLPRILIPPSAMTSHAVAGRIAMRLLDGQIIYIIPNNDVRTLNPLVTTGTVNRYVFNGL